MKKIIFTFLLPFFTLPVLKAQSKEDKQLIKSIDALLADKFNSGTPGCAVLVAKKGQVIYLKSYGTANLELNACMNGGKMNDSEFFRKRQRLVSCLTNQVSLSVSNERKVNSGS